MINSNIGLWPFIGSECFDLLNLHILTHEVKARIQAQGKRKTGAVHVKLYPVIIA